MKITIDDKPMGPANVPPSHQKLCKHLDELPDGQMMSSPILATSAGCATHLPARLHPTIKDKYSAKRYNNGCQRIWGNPHTVKAYKEQNENRD
jgi:hypothetical protein